jgi:predicted small metal-binding protein
MKSFTCRDAGVSCDQKFTGETNDEILSQVKSHAQEKHGVTNFTPDIRTKVQNGIRDENDLRTGTEEDKNLRERKGISAA